jgi:hypothetical protein
MRRKTTKILKLDWDDFIDRLRPFLFLTFPELRGTYTIHIEGIKQKGKKDHFTISFIRKRPPQKVD